MAGRSMGRTASTVGMMEGAFFVSRTDLLQWVNNLLGVSLAKVEQCASGAVYCQIIDACAPGSVVMRKVNWMAKSDHEFIPNYKVLQAAFDKLNIERNIPVDQLIRAKYQDNLEFLQWMKCYWEREGSGRQGYDPVAAREGKAVPAWAKPIGGVMTAPGAGGYQEKENLRPRAAPARAEVEKKAVPKASPAAARPGAQPAAVAAKTPRSAAAAQQAPLNAGSFVETEALRAKVESQSEELVELRQTLDGLERERDYYFRKLRDVEIMCTTLQANMDPAFTAEKVVKDVQGILYAENEEDEARQQAVDDISPLAQESLEA